MGKEGKKSKGSKKGGKPAGNNVPKQAKTEPSREPQLTPQERIDAVRPFWQEQEQPKRVQLLTVDLATLKERARQLAELTRQQAVADVVDHEHLDMLAMGMDTSLEEVLDEGVSRLKQRPTWKLWSWPPDGKDFTDAEAFRQHVIEKHIREDLRKYLPRDDPKSPERPAEESFRKRMQDLLQRVQQQQQRHYEEMAARTAVGSNKEKGIRGKGDKANKDKADKDKPEKGDKIDSKADKDNKADSKATSDGKDVDKDSKADKSDKEADKEASDGKAGDAGTADSAKPISMYRRRRHHAADAAALQRDNSIELINIMLEALEQEHEVLYQMLVLPITVYIMEALPEEGRETKDKVSGKLELSYEDFDRLLPDDLLHIMEWLTEKVDALTTRLKAEPREQEELEEEENMGDVDLWALGEDSDSLTVNSKWLQHLQERLLGEDGHPRKVKAGEDPHQSGLVLEWVYGTIVSTAEKARDGAKRPLGSYLPQPNEAHHALVRALEEQYVWDTRLQQARSLLADMLKSRLEAQELSKTYDIKPVPKAAKPEDLPADDALPDHVLIAILKREVLLTKAKLHYLLWEHITQERQLRTWKSQLKQGEPEFERLKKELEEVKHSHRGLDSTYRSQAEMERHRAQLADAAIEEQLEVQTAFREQGSLLQAIYDKKQRAEYEIARKETEIKQLQGWKATVESLVDKITDLVNAKNKQPAGDEEEGGEPAALNKSDSSDLTWEQGGSAGALSPEQFMQLVKLRNHVQKDVRKQLYSDADDKLFFDSLKNEVKAVERRMEEGRVIIQHLEMQLLNVACDDPGIAVGAQLVLPMLQERLDVMGKDFAAERAKLAEDEIIRMELEQAEREAAERERKRAVKAAKKDRLKCEKEKERTEREAKEAAEAARKQEEAEERRRKEEEDRRKRAEALQALRRAEEEYMEARRRELLSDENGYWRQRMRMDEERAAVEAAVVTLTQGMQLDEATILQARAHADTLDNRRRRSPAPPVSGRREPAAVRADASGVVPEKADGVAGKLMMRAVSVSSSENDSKTASDQTRQRSGLSAAAGPFAEPISSSGKLAAGRGPSTAAPAASPAAPTTPAHAPPPTTMSSPQTQAPTTTTAASSTIAARGVAPAQATAAVPAAPVPAPAAPAAAPRPPAPAAPAPSLAPPPAPSLAPAPAHKPSEQPQVARPTAAPPAIYFGAVPVAVVPPPAKPAESTNQKDAALPASNEAVAKTTPFVQPQHPQVVRPQIHAAPPATPAVPVQASTKQPAGPVSAPGGDAPSGAPVQATQSVSTPAQYPAPAGVVPIRPSMPGMPPAPGQQQQQQQQQLPPPPMPTVSPVGVQVTPVVPQHMRPMMPAQVHMPTAAPGAMSNGPTPPNMALQSVGHRPGNAPAGTNQSQQHPAARQMPMMHYPHHMGPAAPPGPMSVVVPGPMGPMYVYPNPAASAGMLPNGTLPAHLMHHMMGQQHPLTHHGMPPGMPAPTTNMAQGHSGSPDMPAPPPPRGPVPHVSPPPPPPPATQPKDAAAGSMSRSNSNAVDGKAPQEGASGSTGSNMQTGSTSEKSLNVAAKPFVPSIAKIIPVNTMPIHVQHVTPGLDNMVNSPSTTANGPMAPAHYGSMMPGQQPPVMQQPPQGYPAYPPHASMQPGMRGQPPHMQPQPRQDRGGPAPPFRSNVAGTAVNVRPQQPMHVPASPQQAAYMLLPNGGWTGAPMPMMMHPQMNTAQMAPPGAHMAGLQAPPQPPPHHQPAQPHITMHGASQSLPPRMHMAMPGHNVPNQMPMHAMQPGLPAPQPAGPPASGMQPPAPAQQPSDPAQQPNKVDRSAGGLHSPNGPLDRSHGSDSSSASGEDSQATAQQQQQQQQQHTTPQPGEQLPNAAPPQDQQAQSVDRQPLVPGQTQVSSSQTQVAAQRMQQQPADVVQQAMHAVVAPQQTSGQGLTATADGTASPAQAAQPNQATSQASQPRSWSSIAALDKGQGTDHSPSRRAQPATPASGVVSPGVGPAPSTPAAGATPGSQQGPGSSNISPGAGQPSWKHMLQQKLSPASSAPAVPRWAGTPPVGNFSAVQPVPLNGARLQVTDTGAVTYTAREGAAPRSLQLIRGLRNGEGEYNCFLNVIIQSLWHLKPFREAVLALPAPASAGEGLSADAQVLQALSGIFRAMAAPPGTSSPSSSPPPPPPARGGSNGGMPGGTVSPASLRNALAALGQSAVRVEMSDMHDAAEVLGQILECLHRAEASVHSSKTQANGPHAAHDITLPQKVKQSQAGKPHQPASTVHSLFGLDIQVPCPPEDEDSSHSGSGKKMVWNQRSSSQLNNMQNGPSSASAASGPGSDKAAHDFVLQFTKFFHLVPAQGLRQAYADALLPSGSVGCSWEELLVALELAGSAAGHAVDAEGRPVPTSTLLRRPRVFTLGMVWESPQVPPEAIRSTLAAIGQSVELPAVFRIPPAAVSSWSPGPASTYTLRAVVCYFGHHYLAFVLSEELSLWLCFDDADISLVGRWPDVCSLMLARRMQPSLLIYEDVASA